MEYKDPNEYTNQANNPEYAALIKKLTAYLPAQEDMAPEIGRKESLSKSKKKPKKKKKK